jgi:hypothetical protein
MEFHVPGGSAGVRYSITVVSKLAGFDALDLEPAPEADRGTELATGRGGERR